MRQEIPLVILGADGRPYAGASVYVRTSPGGADATVYQARTGGATSPNPLTTDAQGRVTGWLERGDYAATISSVSGLGPWVEEFPILSALDGAIDGAMLPDDVIVARHIAADTVGAPELAPGAVGIPEQANPTIGGRVNGVGGAVIQAQTGNWTVVRNSAGRYTITAPAGYQFTGFSVTAISSGVAYAQIAAVTATTVQFVTASTTAPATPVDSAFMFTATLAPV